MSVVSGTLYTFSSLSDNLQLAFQTTGDAADFLSSDELSFVGVAGFQPINLQFVEVDADGDTMVDDLLVKYDNGVDPSKTVFLLDTTLGKLYQNIMLSNFSSFYWVGDNGASGEDDDGTTINASNNGDYIAGLGGNDSIIAGGGNDRIDMAVGAGGEYGNDTVDGGLGSDLITFGATMTSGVSVNLATGVVTGGAANSSAQLTSVESVFGTSFNDSLTGNGAANTLDGGLDGNDTLSGANGNDNLIGDLGNDVLNGGAGDDFMDGGAGNDVYTVDSMLDTVVESFGGGIDTVKSSISLTLGDNVERLTLTGSANCNGDGNALKNILTGNTGDNALFALGGMDTINGGDGNDSMSGGAASDALTGGLGADRFIFDTKLNNVSNVDTILDFSHAEGDKIWLITDIFTKLGPVSGVPTDLAAGKFDIIGDAHAQDASDYIIYNPTNGALSYDRDGSGSGFAAVQFATVADHPALVASDMQFLVLE